MRKPTRVLRVQRLLFGHCCRCGNWTPTDTLIVRGPRWRTFAGIVSAQRQLLTLCDRCRVLVPQPTIAELLGGIVTMHGLRGAA